MALIERFALCAKWPAKSSVQSWFSGSNPFCLRNSAQRVNSGQYFRAVPASPSAWAKAVTRISMLPLSSTGIWFLSVSSPPP